MILFHVSKHELPQRESDTLICYPTPADAISAVLEENDTGYLFEIEVNRFQSSIDESQKKFVSEFTIRRLIAKVSTECYSYNIGECFYAVCNDKFYYVETWKDAVWASIIALSEGSSVIIIQLVDNMGVAIAKLQKL